MIKKANENDLDLIVRCHLDAFPSFFLTLLGNKFLRRFYSSFIESDCGGLLVAVENNCVLGFAAYSTEPATFFTRLKRHHGIRLFLHALPALIMHPVLVLKKLFRGVFYRGDQVQEIGDAALLSSIGVSPRAAGKNIGSKLLAEVETSVIEAGIQKIYLTTDLNDNVATLGFYKKNGYSEHSVFRQSDDRQMLRLIKQLVEEIYDHK